MITSLQKQTAQAIVNIFETGKLRGNYAQVTRLPGDPGHLTYGRSQATLASGNLYLLIKDYCQTAGAAFAADLQTYLPALSACDTRLDEEPRLHGLLRDAGSDPLMQEVQDAFFDRVFWAPAATAAASLGLTSALSAGTVYDSAVHGSWTLMRDRTTTRHGTPAALGEGRWVKAYLSERRAWLAGHPNVLLRRTTYRVESLLDLVAAEKWSLPLPLRVRGIEITEAALGPAEPVRASAESVRNLRLTEPPMSGEDVRLLQAQLIDAGYVINADGLFDSDLDRIVRDFQASSGLRPDGIVGPATRAALGW